MSPSIIAGGDQYVQQNQCSLYISGLPSSASLWICEVHKYTVATGLHTYLNKEISLSLWSSYLSQEHTCMYQNRISVLHVT